jgi:ankyrin repeat protein
MNKNGDSTQKQTSRISKSTLALLVLGAAVAVVFIIHAWSYLQAYSRPEAEFYRVDKDGLHWDYEALSKAYDESNDSRLHDIMVKARAAHLVPQIIDSMPSGGFHDVSRKMSVIIKLTGHDFSKEFGIEGVWSFQKIERTKRLLHKWWQQNSKEVLATRGPKDRFNVPNHWPSLSLELKTEKSEYLQLEPVRCTAVLNNNSDTWFTFICKIGKPAFQIEYYRVLDDGSTVEIAKTPYPAVWAICGNARRWFAKPKFFTIDAGSYHPVQQWLNSHIETYFEPGKVTIRAVLTPLRGEHKGKRLKSNDLTINISEPKGRDAEAYKLITGTDLDGLRFSTGFEFGEFVHRSARQQGIPVSEYFLKNCGDSIYADYVRYGLAIVLQNRNNEIFVEKMEELASQSSPDFPLLADVYAKLLEHYKKQGEADKMEPLSQKIKPDELVSPDPATAQKIADLIEYVQELGENPNKKDGRGCPLLVRAAEDGHKGTVKHLIAKGADIHATNSNGQTPLYLAAKHRHKEIVEILIAAGAKVNTKCKSGRTPIFWPCVNGYTEVAEILIANGADITVREKSGSTLLIGAVEQNKFDIVKLLIANGVDVNAKDNRCDYERWTPLHWAVWSDKKGAIEIVKLLLEAGADPHAKNNDDDTPLDIAIKKGDKEMVRLLSLYEPAL